MATEDYAVFVKPLSAAEGGGYLATVPDLPGCMSDGDSMAEAIARVADAIEAWIATAREMGRPVPKPGDGRSEFRQRLPRTLHAQLTELARLEGVSLNTLITSLLAESVGRREATPFAGRVPYHAAE